jgi:hypothetical protein
MQFIDLSLMAERSKEQSKTYADGEIVHHAKQYRHRFGST